VLGGAEATTSAVGSRVAREAAGVRDAVSDTENRVSQGVQAVKKDVAGVKDDTSRIRSVVAR
jgi:type IV secretory pathway TrbL component